MTQNAEFSAAHQVLTSPLLLERILTWISEDIDFWPVFEVSKSPVREGSPDSTDDDPVAFIGREGILFRCALVCKQWFHEAARVLWRDWKVGYIFAEAFEKIEPRRRQFYADMIHDAEIQVVEDEDLFQAVQTTFEHIAFPNLKTVRLYVPGWCNYLTNRVELPLFHAPRLATFLIDPEYDCLPVSYAVSQDEWTTLLELITVSYGRLFSITGRLVYYRSAFHISRISSSWTKLRFGRAKYRSSRLDFHILRSWI